MINVPTYVATPLLVVAFLLTVAFVPFRHRTLVSGADGGFEFREERVWAPLWSQPTFDSGVAEYPFRVLLVEWGLLAVAAVASARGSARRRRPS